MLYIIFAPLLHLNRIALIQSESSNFFMYIIISVNTAPQANLLLWAKSYVNEGLSLLLTMRVHLYAILEVLHIANSWLAHVILNQITFSSSFVEGGIKRTNNPRRTTIRSRVSEAMLDSTDGEFSGLAFTFWFPWCKEMLPFFELRVETVL